MRQGCSAAEAWQALRESALRRGGVADALTAEKDRLVKEISPNGTYRYTTPSQEEDNDASRRLMEIFREGCISFDHALHTVVIKTLPGLASAVCGAVDSMWDENILGTVAGDDTGILIMRNAAAAERLCAQLRRTCKR